MERKVETADMYRAYTGIIEKNTETTDIGVTSG